MLFYNNCNVENNPYQTVLKTIFFAVKTEVKSLTPQYKFHDALISLYVASHRR